MVKKGRVSSVLGVLLFMAAAEPTVAQTITGSVTGSVVDDSGAIIVGAKVTLTNTGTSETQNAPSDSSGNFQFLLLPPGNYVLDISNPGFKTFRREGIIVEADRSLAVPVSLTVGQTTETIEVVGGTPLLDTSTSEVGTTIDQQKVMDLPLNARNPMGLANLIPAVKGVGYFGNQVLTSWRVGSINIGGGQALTSAFLLDGVANDKMGDASGPNTFLTTDSTGEFKIITNSMSAEYGRTTGGVISAISKSGQNAYHGSAFDYLQNTALNANNFFNNAAGTPLAPVHQNQFGGSMGGRIIRDRLFFFANFEGFIQHLSNSAIFSAPTAAQRVGDFSATTASGKQIVIYDPSTTIPNPASPGTYIRTAFTGNMIPTSRISPFAQAFFSLFPLPNLPGQVSNLFLIGQTPTSRYTGGGKLDYLLSSTQRVSFRYTADRLDETTPNGSYFQSVLDNDKKTIFVPRHSGFLSYTNTLSPTLILDIRSSINRDYDQATPWSFVGKNADTNWLAFLHLPQSFINQIPPLAQQFPALTISGLGGSLGGYGSAIQNRAAYEWGDVISLTKIKGRHTIQAGYQYTLYRGNPYDQAPPAFNFTAGFTQGPNPTVASANAGYGTASMELGLPASGSYTYQNSHEYQELDHGVYVQDDWKVNRKLTLNLGLRWEYQGPFTDRNNEMTNFSLTDTTTVNGVKLVGGAIFPGTTGIPRGVVDQTWNHFAPRFGFAYQTTSKLVVRGGYGIFWVPERGVLEPAATGFSLQTSMVTSLDNGITPYNTIANPYPQGLVQPTGASAGLLTNLGGAITGQLRGVRQGYAQQWNLTLQYSPWTNWLIEGAYLANKGTHLQQFTNNLNQLNPLYLSLGNALNSQVPNPYYGLIGNGQLSTPTITLQQSLLPFPQFTSVNGGWYYPGVSFYNAFTLKVEKRFSQGFSVLLSYANSKLLDASASTSTVTGGNTSTGILNYYNLLEGEYSKAVQDIPQRLVLTGLWAEPFFKQGRQWERLILGGWNISTVASFQSGQTLSVSATNNLGTNRPNVVAGVSAQVPNPSLSQWFNTAAFSIPAPFTYGNSSRTIPNVMGPRLINVDFALYKDFVIKERVTATLRGEAFNLANRPDFNNPATNASLSTFGTITSTLVTPLPRNCQLSLRLTF
ncbi:MAG TPA: TonB-dependent receptor [Bryobacteraceae bacterium]|nr:TonB-dependent receptor [Bryobacteraceae bacterium]